MKGYYTVSRIIRAGFLAACFALLLPAVAGAQDAAVFEDGPPDYTQERLDFWQARTALTKGNLAAYQSNLERLQDYPLVGYLYYDYLLPRLSQVPPREVQDFLLRFDDTPISARLRSAWLHELGRSGRWDTYLETYQAADEQDTALNCYALRARLSGMDVRDPPQDWLAGVEKLWLVGRSQPDECTPLFTAWRKGGHLSTDLIWQRITLAMENRELDLAGYLAKELDAEGQRWVARWQRMYKAPEDMLQHPDYVSDVAKARTIVRYGIKRLARDDAALAAAQWEQLKTRYTFSAEESAMTERDIAIAAALERLPEALSLLSAVDDSQVDEKVRQWRVRSAVAQQDWPAVLKWIETMNDAERAMGDWRYWKARALQNLTTAPADASVQGDPKILAKEIYTELARERTYYGFLANDQLGNAYEIEADPILVSAEEMTRFLSLPNMVRIEELKQLGMDTEFYSEWQYALSRFDQRQLEVAAVVAHRWGWYDRAIFASAKANHRDDLELRFPLLYKEAVYANAAQSNLDPAWVYGVIRQESAFAPEARSSAGALGLMQLMPATGRKVAKGIKVRLKNTGQILDTDKNIRLGTAYLREVLDENNGHQALATASYNAGPHRVRQWLPAATLPADIWVETIPFTETRNYVQQVMAFTTIFSQRLGREIVPLRARMPDVHPLGE
jgi:soluble lytic murein transglycosylase